MRKLILILSIIFFSLPGIAAIAPGNSIATITIENKITENPIPSFLNISSLKIKQVEKLLGKKLTLKEKIAFKVFQWKLKSKKTPQSDEPSKKGKTAMILGIIAIGSLFLPYIAIAAIPCAILAIVFGTQAKRENPHDGKAKTGIVLGIITLGLIVLLILLVLAFLSAFHWG